MKVKKDPGYGERFRELIEMTGLKRREVAKRSNYDNSSFTHLCNREIPFKDFQLQRIEWMREIFGINTDYLNDPTAKKILDGKEGKDLLVASTAEGRSLYREVEVLKGNIVTMSGLIVSKDEIIKLKDKEIDRLEILIQRRDKTVKRLKDDNKALLLHIEEIKNTVGAASR